VRPFSLSNLSLKRIDHIGIAVKDLDDSISTFKDKLGLVVTNVVEMKDQKLKIGLVNAGNCFIELMEPLDQESTVAKFLAKNCGRNGIHHIAFSVDGSLERVAEVLKLRGVNMVYPESRIGVMGHPINFCHPKFTSDILIELCEVAAP
jgi:methylmalonyl-CoA epimerase